MFVPAARKTLLARVRDGQAVVLEGAAGEGQHAGAQGGVAADDQVPTLP